MGIAKAERPYRFPKAMRVGFYLADQNPHRDRSLGITSYTEGLLQQLQKRPQEISLLGLTSKSSYSPGTDIPGCRLPFRTDSGFGRLVADQFHPWLARSSVDLWHYPKGHLPLGMRYDKPLVGTVHDVILQYYADHYPRARSRAAYAYWLAVLRHSIPRFDLILTVSKFSERSIHEFCDRHGLRCPPIHVTYEGPGFVPGNRPIAKKNNSVVHLASREPHKGTRLLLALWRELSRENGNLPRLCLIGNLSAFDASLARTIPDVNLQGRLPKVDLEAAIAQALAVILPSEVEGFGLPALEAYILQTPVVYVKDTAVEEIIGEGSPGGFHLHDLPSFDQALKQTLNMSQGECQERSKVLSEKFSWGRCVASTVEAYKQLL